jgi:hypothetical protein
MVTAIHMSIDKYNYVFRIDINKPSKTSILHEAAPANEDKIQFKE